jgi:hypothetical protein
VTLSACSAAFAAMSTALLCILILNGGPGNNQIDSRTQLTESYHVDYPRIDQPEVRCAESYGATSLPPRRQYERRTIYSLSNGNNSSTKIVPFDSKTSDIPKGVVWLMVSICCSLFI